MLALHYQNTAALNDSRVQAQKIGPTAVFIAQHADWYFHIIDFGTPVKTLPQLKHDLKFEDQKAVLFQLYDKMQTLHIQELYHGGINKKNILFSV